ncbi:tRNA (cytidine/uridine-2'-O-)-methyltransferase [Stella humosa]|uniref:tRNA (cytidine(34)-2'-O)-methyltransferase n=1 Tax=Stella humosa TaxID=94 RepID=A0A3N1KWX7_9PROT|nr:tRNA (cytidine(34)-2'-O)-methyltransferase [Stella humosa]ROP83279.1 tRNA (cytidine/uridine-2'-O-)-methyltransferase [Stella humosa]BBK29938.1 tRNA (cytidine(34)-2'-O)-methyltransferase [Stella humosa]
MRIALYEPDIPQNVGTIIRLGACLGVPVDLIEPFGFVWNDQRLRRAGMDYLDLAAVSRHVSWRAYRDRPERASGRLVLLTRHAPLPYTAFAFAPGDTLLLGRESAGVPPAVHGEADARVTVPLCRGLRSLNVAVVAAMILGEALRQTAGFPTADGEPAG